MRRRNERGGRLGLHLPVPLETRADAGALTHSSDT